VSTEANEKASDSEYGEKTLKTLDLRHSMWQFDATDATEMLQGAINTHFPRILVPNYGSPWYVQPITLVSNQEIIFEPGVEIMAKAGEFPNGGESNYLLADCLFKASGVKNLTLKGYGATFKMTREEYPGSTIRHCLSLLSCENVRVEGLTIKESGGDGIFLGFDAFGDATVCKNINIKDVICDNNWRNNLSITCGEDIVVENCIFKNAKGTNPQGGVDIEPGRKWSKINNVTLRDCVFEGNFKYGLNVNLGQMENTSDGVSILVVDCKMHDNGRHGILMQNMKNVNPCSWVKFTRCQVKYDHETYGLFIKNKSLTDTKVCFQDCNWSLSPLTWTRPAWQGEKTALVVAAVAPSPTSIGGIDFTRCKVEDTRSQAVLKLSELLGASPKWENITGNIDVVGTTYTVDLPSGVSIDLDVKAI